MVYEVRSEQTIIITFVIATNSRPATHSVHLQDRQGGLCAVTADFQVLNGWVGVS